MMMLSLIRPILILQVFAHSDLETYICAAGGTQVTITPIHGGKIKVEDLASAHAKKVSFEVQKPDSTDRYDDSKKQLFDTYVFKNKEHAIELWVPETEGPDKLPFVRRNQRVLPCQRAQSK